jgi:hypothetical protein
MNSSAGSNPLAIGDALKLDVKISNSLGAIVGLGLAAFPISRPLSRRI